MKASWSRRKASWSRRRSVVAVALMVALALTTVAFAQKRMQSTKLGPKLCETTYGGKFVDIPDFPGEKLDRRLLADVKFLQRKYRIFVTDGYSMSDVHASNGEHPIGLALDIVPDKAAGGSWTDIDRLARWAEPRQDHPRAPFRWVGYDGDPNHGRGHHLHLSWSHTDTRPGRPAATVYSIRCPDSTPRTPPPEPRPPGDADDNDTDTGIIGIDPDSGGTTGGPTGGSGGIGKLGLAPAVPETGGVELGE